MGLSSRHADDASGRRAPPDRQAAGWIPCVRLGGVTDQAGLVGQHDELDPVAGAGLGEQPADVGLHGRLGDHQVGGDLRVGAAAADQLEHLALALGERGQPVVVRAVGAGRAARRRSARAAAGWCWARPPSRRRARVRIAPSRSGGAASLSRNAAAPALIAAKAYSSRSNVVSTITRGRVWSGLRARRVASTPSTRGIRTSISTTSAGGDGEPLEGLGAVARLADHREVRLAVDEHPEAGAHHLLVVDEEHPDRTAQSQRDPRGHPEAAAGRGVRPRGGRRGRRPARASRPGRGRGRRSGPRRRGRRPRRSMCTASSTRTSTRARASGPACLRTLLSASWTTR